MNPTRTEYHGLQQTPKALDLLTNLRGTTGVLATNGRRGWCGIEILGHQQTPKARWANSACASIPTKPPKNPCCCCVKESNKGLI